METLYIMKGIVCGAGLRGPADRPVNTLKKRAGLSIEVLEGLRLIGRGRG